jgi:two-component system, cell cycle response regulator
VVSNHAKLCRIVAGADEEERTKTSEIQRDELEKAVDRSAMLLILGSGARLVTGKMFKLVQGETVIGRSAQCEVSMPDDGISRRHARLLRLPNDDYVIEDLDSRNGTFLNGNRVTERTPLKPGDKIQVGSTTVLLFAVQDALEAQFQMKMYEAATHDTLTGLYNRKYLYDALSKEFPYCNRHEVPLSMLMIDIDFFKQVNDSHGHLAGDFVLCRVAEALMKATRAEDLVSRFGGEEFAVLLRETDAAGAAICGERCRNMVAAGRYEIKSRPVGVTLSCGVATLVNRCFNTPEELIHAADQALYAAKAAGRNQVMTYSAARPGVGHG